MDLDSVLKQMRTEYTPNDEDRKRVENTLTATLLAGSVTGAAHLAASGTGASIKGALAKGSLKLLPVWLKGAIGVGATVAAVGGGVYGVSEYRAQQNTPVVAPQTAAQTHVQTIAHSPVVRAPEQVVPQVVLPVALPVAESAALAQNPSAVIDSPTTAPAALPQAMAHGALSQAKPRTPAADQHLTSLGELKLIGEASRALQDGRSQDAEKALREHERRYTHTALGQERTGLALLARCANGSAAAAGEASEFLHKNPNSPLATRIKRECLK